MTTNTYSIGDDVTEIVEFESDGLPADPSNVRFTYQLPDGSQVALIYGIDPEITRESTGLYTVTLSPSVAGLWRFQWVGSGSLDKTATGAFFVSSSFPTVRDRFADVDLMAAYLAMDIDPADLLALAALEAATAAIQKYCDQSLILVVDDTEIVDGTGSDILLLPEFPVVDVTAVLENCDQTSPTALVASTDYDVTASGLLLRRGSTVAITSSTSASFGTWPNRRRSVQVTYSHGYGDIPMDIKLVCVAAAARTYAQDGASQETTGTYNVSYAGQPSTLTDAEKRILDRYRSRKR